MKWIKTDSVSGYATATDESSNENRRRALDTSEVECIGTYSIATIALLSRVVKKKRQKSKILMTRWFAELS
jgi:hypothetical protein